MVCTFIGVYFVFNKKDKYHDYLQEIDYSESIVTIHNPDQGFYSAACVQVGQETIADRSYIINDNYQIYHLRMDIS